MNGELGPRSGSAGASSDAPAAAPSVTNGSADGAGGAGACILVVEDDPNLARLLQGALEEKGYTVRRASSGAAAHAVLDQLTPDLILLDLLLPDVDGLVLCGDLKARVDVPIIVCSALAPQPNAVLSLRLGADDFVSKPFRLDELEARIAAALRRPGGVAAGTADAGPRAPESQAREERRAGALVVHRSRHLATLAGVPLPLTPTEYRLLDALAERVEDAVSRQELGDAIWGAYDPALGRSMDVHVAHLRAKLAAAGRGLAPQGAGVHGVPVIEAVRGFGFRLVVPVGVAASGSARS